MHGPREEQTCRGALPTGPVIVAIADTARAIAARGQKDQGTMPGSSLRRVRAWRRGRVSADIPRGAAGARDRGPRFVGTARDRRFAAVAAHAAEAAPRHGTVAAAAAVEVGGCTCPTRTGAHDFVVLA
jgi:hypothetical protein